MSKRPMTKPKLHTQQAWACIIGRVEDFIAFGTAHHLAVFANQRDAQTAAATDLLQFAPRIAPVEIRELPAKPRKSRRA